MLTMDRCGYIIKAVSNESCGVVCVDGLQRTRCEAIRLGSCFCSKSDMIFKGPDMMGGN